MKYYGRADCNGFITQPGGQVPFNFQLINTNSKSTAFEFRDIIQEYLDALPKGENIQPNWVVSAVDVNHHFFE